MPLSKNQYGRLVAIDQALKSGRWKSLEQLADACENLTGSRPSMRSIENDIRLLRSRYSAPIPKAQRPEGRARCYRYAEKGWSFLNELVSREELMLLKEVKALLEKYQSLPLAKALEEPIRKLDAVYESYEMRGKTCIEPESGPVQKGIEHMSFLFRAVREEEALDFLYKPYTVCEALKMSVSPYLLKENRKRWYLIGRQHADGRIVNLALDRIQKVEKSKEAFRSRGDFDPAEYFKDVIGISRPYDSEAEEVLVRADEESAAYWLSKPIHRSQRVLERAEGSVLFSFHLIPNKELKAELGRMAPHVEILKPAWLRREFAEEIGRWLERMKAADEENPNEATGPEK